MNRPENDIEIIRKYYNGELSPAARQELEERALDDPFLQDAMMGFEDFGLNNETIAELNQKLEERLIEKKNRFIGITWGMKQWSIAASLILFISVLSIYLNQTPENKPIAVSEIQKKEDLPKSVKIIPDKETEEKSIIQPEVASGPLIAENNITAKPLAKSYSPEDEISVEPMVDHSKMDSLQLNEVVVVGYGSQQKREVTGAVTRIQSAELESAKKEKLLAENKSAARQALRSTISTAPAKLIKGKVTDISSDDDLPGVQIMNMANGLFTTSDAKGDFSLAGNSNDSLRISYVGYEPEVLGVNQKDSLKIQLKPSTAALSEVVIVGYGQNQNTYVLAGPKGGWHTFRKYLDKNAQLNNNQTGKVIVQFNIQKNGQLTDFKVLKTFSNAASEKALKLIKDYNSWHGAANGITQNVKVTVRFK